jgi:hypothetical protein
MKNLIRRITVALAATMIALTSAHARTYHYACKNEKNEYSHYALTVNTDRRIVKVFNHGPPHDTLTFQILKVASVDECGKYGWILGGGAKFCTATQGYGSLEWRAGELVCDNADTD